MFTNIPFMIITVYIIILFAIGFYAKSKATGDADSYIRASKQLTAPLVFVSMVGLVIGGASTIGISESAFKIGLSAGWYNAAAFDKGFNPGSIVLDAPVVFRDRRG